MNTDSALMKMFTKIDTYEDCPHGCELLTWDGCDFGIDWIDVCVETGCSYASNGTEFTHYLELPSQDNAEALINDGDNVIYSYTPELESNHE